MLDFCVQHTFHNNIFLDLIGGEFVGTIGTVAAAAIGNYRFVAVVVDNYTLFVVVADFVDNEVYIVGFVVVVLYP